MDERFTRTGRFHESKNNCENCGKEIVLSTSALGTSIRHFGYVLAIEQATEYICPYSSWFFFDTCSVECAAKLLLSYIAKNPTKEIIYTEIKENLKVSWQAEKERASDKHG